MRSLGTYCMISLSTWLTSLGVMSNNPSNNNPPSAAINIVQNNNNNNQNHGSGSGSGSNSSSGNSNGNRVSVGSQHNASPIGLGVGSVMSGIHQNLAAEGSMERGRYQKGE